MNGGVAIICMYPCDASCCLTPPFTLIQSIVSPCPALTCGCLLSIYLSLYLSIYLFIYLSSYLFIYLTYLSIKQGWQLLVDCCQGGQAARGVTLLTQEEEEEESPATTSKTAVSGTYLATCLEWPAAALGGSTCLGKGRGA